MYISLQACSLLARATGAFGASFIGMSLLISSPTGTDTLLLDFNGSLFCFDHRASRLKIKPSAPPRRSIPEPTSAMQGE